MSHYPTVRYLQGAWQTAQFPRDEGREIAFAGRSNSGKSSAINAIVGRTGLARTSKTPGRTQLINFFELEARHRLVDLPGYGFAKVAPEVKHHWLTLVNSYLADRASLTGLVIVMDARHPLSEFDWQMLNWAKERDLAAYVLLSKADKLNQTERQRTLGSITARLQDAADVQLFSATAKSGIQEARQWLDATLANGTVGQ